VDVVKADGLAARCELGALDDDGGSFSGVPRIATGHESPRTGVHWRAGILTAMSIAMQITSKGQVTIPQEIRERLGLLPHTEVEFQVLGDYAQIRKVARPTGVKTRGQLAIEALQGTANLGMTTDEIMALTRGEQE
jgi:AbrB family looped-hinge helix DNA binding protein